MSELGPRMRAATLGVLDEMREHLVELEPIDVHSRIGHVLAVGDGVARVVGLERPFSGELLDVGGVDGIAEDLREEEVRVVLLGRSSRVQAGDTVRRSGRVLDVPVGLDLLGRVVDPLGRALDGGEQPAARRRTRVHPRPTPLIDRDPVHRPLRTGVFTLDTMIPIGLGQRQLIIGDRSTGKTELGLDILASSDADVIGVYVAIGRRGSETAANLEWLRARGFFRHGFAVVSDADDPPGMVHLTPYAACSMAEELAVAGRDVVVVYDDLTIHADVHRSLALLLGRPVGREAHPVDVFYAHARLLERATQFSQTRGGGSLTAFPLVETQSGDLTAYVPTNIVSITDGQIRLDADLLASGLTPAVDVALSVSRVGGKAQPALVRALAGRFKNRYAQFLELESFARFGTRLEASSQAVVDWGRRVRHLLTQERGVTRSWSQTVARLLVADAAALLDIPLEEVSERVEAWCNAIVAEPRFRADAIDEESIAKDAIEDLRAVVQSIVAPSAQEQPKP